MLYGDVNYPTTTAWGDRLFNGKVVTVNGDRARAGEARRVVLRDRVHCGLDTPCPHPHRPRAAQPGRERAHRGRRLPLDVRRKGEEWRRIYPRAALTPNALVKHWPALEPRRSSVACTSAAAKGPLPSGSSTSTAAPSARNDPSPTPRNSS